MKLFELHEDELDKGEDILGRLSAKLKQDIKINGIKHNVGSNDLGNALLGFSAGQDEQDAEIDNQEHTDDEHDAQLDQQAADEVSIEQRLADLEELVRSMQDGSMTEGEADSDRFKDAQAKLADQMATLDGAMQSRALGKGHGAAKAQYEKLKMHSEKLRGAAGGRDASGQADRSHHSDKKAGEYDLSTDESVQEDEFSEPDSQQDTIARLQKAGGKINSTVSLSNEQGETAYLAKNGRRQFAIFPDGTYKEGRPDSFDGWNVSLGESDNNWA